MECNHSESSARESRRPERHSPPKEDAASMKKQLSIGFNTRQYMQSGDFELFYYNDINLDHVSSHRHDYS